MSKLEFDIAFVGGGLAGIVGAARAHALGMKVALVDKAFLGPSSGRLGGFAAFSGAKFSFFPAGTGLAPLCGGNASLIEAYSEVGKFLAAGLPGKDFTAGAEGQENLLGSDLEHRDYKSIVLTPDEISELIRFLSGKLAMIPTLHAEVTAIGAIPKGGFAIDLVERLSISAAKVVVTAGRLGANLLGNAGCQPQPGRGIDLGVRLEFPDRKAIGGLRALGPDAKILHRDTRTFCLNSPGSVYRYPYQDISIPGGVVAGEAVHAGNVGILRRCRKKEESLARVLAGAAKLGVMVLERPGRISGSDIRADRTISAIYGDEIAGDLADFTARLEADSLIDFSGPYFVHKPLLDWHWPVYSLPGTFETTIKGLFAVGDASGHARGLLQAATAGWLCAGYLAT